ncbi:serine-rich adhesin for platelets-like [Mytilus edulis]|uniref:serine-rich adhesin for platelets-like n=1 Tax=Mytilus edulis TaxID=6550 RepID=UPI0039EE848B
MTIKTIRLFCTIRQSKQSDYSVQYDDQNNQTIQYNQTIKTIRLFSTIRQSKQSDYSVQSDNQNNQTIQYNTTIKTIRLFSTIQQSKQSDDQNNQTIQYNTTIKTIRIFSTIRRSKQSDDQNNQTIKTIRLFSTIRRSKQSDDQNNQTIQRKRDSADYKNYPISSSDSYSITSRDQLTRSSTFDEVDSVNSASYDSKFSRQSSFDGYNQPYSSRSSLSTFSLSGLSRSASQDGNFSDSRASSLTSLINSAEGSHNFCPENAYYSPLLEKLFEDAESLNLLPKQRIGCVGGKQSRTDSRGDLILPDDEEEEIPFAKYTFNKKPESTGSRSPSEKSSSSKDSRESRESFDKSVKRAQYLQSTSNDSFLSSSLTSSHFDPESPSSSGKMDGRTDSTDRNHGGKQVSSHWTSFNANNEPMIYPTPMPHGYPGQRPNFPFPVQPNPPYFPPMSSGQQPPDQVLMNLGFGDDVENFLPARFAQDWKQKIIQKQQEMYLKAQAELYYQPVHLHQRNNFTRQTSEITSSDSSPEMDLTSRSSISSLSRAGSNSKITTSSTNPKQALLIEEKVIAERQSSIQKLRDLLQSDSVISSVNKEKNGNDLRRREAENKEKAMDFKRKQFARARQKSLPIYLEPLNEEDEISAIKNKLIKAKLHMDSQSNGSTKSPSENSTSDQSVSSSARGSVSSSTRGSIGDSNFTDCDINTYLIDKENGNKSVEKVEEFKIEGDDINNPNVPSICVENNTMSNESIEIDEILGNHRNELHVEPAMITVVLSDTDSKHTAPRLLSHLTPNFLGWESDDKMSRRRSSSSLSISPMPSSPVTVIEVGLDNQNDSLENVTDSIDMDDFNHKDSLLHDFSATLEEKINHPKEYLKRGDSLVSQSIVESDENVECSTMKKTYISQVNHVLQKNSIEIEIPNLECQDMCIQADDGSLSPIIRFTDYEYLFQKLVNVDDGNLFYLAKHCGTQYEAQPENISLDSDKIQCFFNNTPEASSSRRQSFSGPNLSLSGPNLQKVHNTFHKDVEVQTDSESKQSQQEMGIQTDEDLASSRPRVREISTSTSQYITRCSCSSRFDRSDSDSSNASDIQLSLQATIDRLEKKTRKYRALYGKKD